MKCASWLGKSSRCPPIHEAFHSRSLQFPNVYFEKTTIFCSIFFLLICTSWLWKISRIHEILVRPMKCAFWLWKISRVHQFIKPFFQEAGNFKCLFWEYVNHITHFVGEVKMDDHHQLKTRHWIQEILTGLFL